MSYATMSKIGQMGRCGNMLFQIACVYGYARKHNLEPIIPPFKYADSFVGPFNQSEIIEHSLPGSKQYLEPHFHFVNIPKMENVDLEGYWQSELYFLHCKEEILSIFAFKPEIIHRTKYFIDGSRKGKIPVAVHMRFTDYLTMSHYYHNLSSDWYKQAMSMFDPATHHFFVVSDDITMARVHTPVGCDITFSGFDEVTDLCIMSLCSGLIMCNSSFSWFGGYLGKQDKRVIAPKLWFHDIAGHSTADLYLKHWELI